MSWRVNLADLRARLGSLRGGSPSGPVQPLPLTDVKHLRPTQELGPKLENIAAFTALKAIETKLYDHAQEVSEGRGSYKSARPGLWFDHFHLGAARGLEQVASVLQGDPGDPAGRLRQQAAEIRALAPRGVIEDPAIRALLSRGKSLVRLIDLPAPPSIDAGTATAARQQLRAIRETLQRCSKHVAQSKQPATIGRARQVVETLNLLAQRLGTGDRLGRFLAQESVWIADVIAGPPEADMNHILQLELDRAAQVVEARSATIDARALIAARHPYE